MMAYMFRAPSVLLLLAFAVTTPSAWAVADCRLDTAVCKEGLTTDPHYVAGQTVVTPCKTISGYSVCLSDIGKTCWDTRQSYTCLKPNAVDYCQPLAQLSPQCWQTNSQCTQTDTIFGSGCMTYTQTYRCGDPSLPAPTNTIQLDSSYTVVQDSINTSACASYADNPNCSLSSHVCVQGPETRNINGLPVYKDCWQWQDDYSCTALAPTLSSDCQPLIDKGCKLVNTTCVHQDGNGVCNLYDKTYSCVVTASSTTTTNNCSSQYCANGQCFNTGSPADGDMGTVITMTEVLREAGTYLDPATMRVFNGTDDRCTVKLFGFANCCKRSSGGAAFANSALFSAGLTVGGEILDVGSSYVYDALQGSSSVQQGLGSVFGMTGANGMFDPTFNFYGFDIQFSFANGFQLTGFDPYSLAFQVGMMVLSDMLSCTSEEQLMAMKMGQNLCVFVGSYCSMELNLLVAKICLEKTQTHCCYNSRLARIINEQGRPQLGISWGTPESPNCQGMTTEQLQALDFSKIDMTEFIAEIVPKTPNISTLTTTNQQIINQKVNNYYNQ